MAEDKKAEPAKSEEKKAPPAPASKAQHDKLRSEFDAFKAKVSQALGRSFDD